MRGKRKQQRYVKRCEVEFVSDGLTHRGISSDFSLNGLFIRTNFPLSPNTPVDLTVHFSDGTSSKLRVKVIRAWRTATGRVMGTPIKSAKNGMGVEIIEKDASYLHFIRSLLG
jgi:hypothetical protein